MHSEFIRFRLLSLLIASACLYSIHSLAYAKDTLSIGVLPRHNYTETIKMFLPLSKHLTKELGIRVTISTTKNFDSFWKNVEANAYDVIHVNQYQYLSAHKKFGYRILMKNEEFGQSTIQSIIVARKDSGINSVQDLKGKHVIFGGNSTAMMSYLIPVKMMHKENISPGQYHSSFAVTPPNALIAVYLKSADACGVGDVVLKLKSVKDVVDLNELKIISQSEAIPHLAWATQKKLPNNLRDEIEKGFLKLNDSEQGLKILNRAKLTGIHRATHDEYSPLEQYIDINNE